MKTNIINYVGKDSKGNQMQVQFEYYRQGNFYYKAYDYANHESYVFPVPMEDIGTATMLRTDRAITFMRWIRKAMEDGTFIKDALLSKTPE